MTPPSENKTAQTTMNTLLSACNSKQKVRAGPLLTRVVLIARRNCKYEASWSSAAALQGLHGAHRPLRPAALHAQDPAKQSVDLCHCPCRSLMRGNGEPFHLGGPKKWERKAASPLFGRSWPASKSFRHLLSATFLLCRFSLLRATVAPMSLSTRWSTTLWVRVWSL